MNAIDTAKFDELEAQGIHLITGAGNLDQKTLCTMQAVNWAATGQTSDMPECVHPILSRFVQRLQDSTNDEAFKWRLLRECGPLLVGTNEWSAVDAARVVALAGRTVAGFREALETIGADLSGADLSGANLYGANLYGADLYGANLYGANLYGANLSRANLSRANLSGANLYGANLSRADLSGANLSGALGYTLPAGWKVTESGLVVRS